MLPLHCRRCCKLSLSCHLFT